MKMKIAAKREAEKNEQQRKQLEEEKLLEEKRLLKLKQEEEEDLMFAEKMKAEAERVEKEQAEITRKKKEAEEKAAQESLSQLQLEASKTISSNDSKPKNDPLSLFDNEIDDLFGKPSTSTTKSSSINNAATKSNKKMLFGAPDESDDDELGTESLFTQKLTTPLSLNEPVVPKQYLFGVKSNDSPSKGLFFSLFSFCLYCFKKNVGCNCSSWFIWR